MKVPTGGLQVTAILSWIVRSWTDVENNIVSVERVNEYADTTKEVSLSRGRVHIDPIENQFARF